VVCYLVMRHELRAQVDDALGRQGGLVVRAAPAPASTRLRDRVTFQLPAPPPRAGGPAPYAQALDKRGKVVRAIDTGLPPIPVTARDKAVAAGKAGAYEVDRVIDGDHVRVSTVATPGGGAFMLGRSLAGVDSTLSRLRWLLLALCLAGTALAAALGRLFSRPVIQPVTDLTDAAEHITATEDLARRVDARGSDEVGRMAARFNTMLDTLEGSVEAQRRLVADASHELRTPVTSLRTNIEVLLAGEDLPEPSRRRLLEDVREQTEELSGLITDVIELARGDVPLSGTEDVRLDEIAAVTAGRVGRSHPDVHFALDLEPSVVEGLPDRLARAVGNLLDNAAKYGPPGGVVEVRVRGGEVAVRDHGPGVPAAEAPFVFDRFSRGSSARGRLGSGLGLAIVRQVAESHGGGVTVEAPPGGGALFRLRLPLEETLTTASRSSQEVGVE
jgi:two-component system, OmpR family, sensor histidine kinase MprB